MWISRAPAQILSHPWVTEDMPQSLVDLNDDILLSSPRTAARRGVMAAVARRDAAFGTKPGQGGFTTNQSEVSEVQSRRPPRVLRLSVHAAEVFMVVCKAFICMLQLGNWWWYHHG